MLARLHSLVLAGNVPVEDAVNFLASLFDIEAPDRSYGFLDSSPFDRIAGITYWHLQRVDKAKRADLLIEALKNARHFALAIKVLWDFARDPAPESNVAPLLPAAEDRERLRKASLDKIRAAAVEGDDTQVDELFQISGHWANWDEAAAQSWVASHLDTRDAIAKFLKQIQSTADGTGGPKKFIQVGSFERIIPPNILVEKVESASRSDGSLHKARAMATRCCWPPDSSLRENGPSDSPGPRLPAPRPPCRAIAAASAAEDEASAARRSRCRRPRGE